MRIKILFFATALLSLSFAKATTLSCAGDEGSMSFELNLEQNNLVFSNVSAFGNAQIVTGQSLPLKFVASNQVYFEYDWYYTARYEMTFDSNLQNIQIGDTVGMSLSGDDNDGSFFENKAFLCEVKK